MARSIIILFALIIASLVFYVGTVPYYWVLFVIILGAAVYALSSEIDWWWVTRKPPEIGPEMRAFITHNILYYQQLSVWEKTKFEERLSLFVLSKDYEILGTEEDPPGEVKGIIGATAVMISFGREQILQPGYERFKFYPSAFATPDMHFLHGSEIHSDGLVLFAMDRLYHGFKNSATGFDFSIYEMARIYAIEWEAPWEHGFEMEEYDVLTRLLMIRGNQTVLNLKQYTGLEELDVVGIAAEVFFTRATKLKYEWPEMYESLSLYYNQDPVNVLDPVIKKLSTAE